MEQRQPGAVLAGRPGPAGCQIASATVKVPPQAATAAAAAASAR